jgi:hypothetical protein
MQSAYPALATVGPANITFIENGWSGEGFAIHLSQGISGCGAPPTEFGIPATHGAYKELVALLMSAYFTEKPVEVVVDTGNCTLGARTSIISIRLR